MGVTGSSLDGEDTTLDVEEGHIEGTTTEIVDQDVALLLRLARAETVGDSGGSGLVDDTEDVEARDGTGVLGGLTLVVVEVGGDGNDSLLNLLAELGLGNLLHLWWLLVAWTTKVGILRANQTSGRLIDLRNNGGAYLEENHGGDLLGGELLLLAEVVNLNLGLTVVIDDLEGPGLDVLLDGGVIETTADKAPVRGYMVSHELIGRQSHGFKDSLGVEDSVDGVHGGIVLGGLTDQTLLLGEGNE